MNTLAPVKWEEEPNDWQKLPPWGQAAHLYNRHHLGCPPVWQPASEAPPPSDAPKDRPCGTPTSSRARRRTSCGTNDLNPPKRGKNAMAEFDAEKLADRFAAGRSGKGVA